MRSPHNIRILKYNRRDHKEYAKNIGVWNGLKPFHTRLMLFALSLRPLRLFRDSKVRRILLYGRDSSVYSPSR